MLSFFESHFEAKKTASYILQSAKYIGV